PPRALLPASPAAMIGLAGIVGAPERAQLLVEAPALHHWPALTGLTADSRKVERGMLYCAVRGSVQDGHQFVTAARQRGAAAALVEREQDADLPQGLVPRGRRAGGARGGGAGGAPAAGTRPRWTSRRGRRRGNLVRSSRREARPRRRHG